MNWTCPTVRIKSEVHPEGVIINESDFDPEKHERHSDKPPKESAVVDDDSSDGKGMSVADMRALLAERQVDVPEGTRKAGLRVLVESSNPPPVGDAVDSPD